MRHDRTWSLTVHLSPRNHAHSPRLLLKMADRLEVERLFSKCCKEILSSSSLVQKAPIFLPKPLVHYLLLVACETSNTASLVQLLKHWNFPDLTLTFSENTFWCRDRVEGYRWQSKAPGGPHESHTKAHRLQKPACITPNEYYGIWCSRELPAECVSAIAVGLYEYVRHNLSIRGGVPPLTVDLTGAYIEDGQLYHR